MKLVCTAQMLIKIPQGLTQKVFTILEVTQTYIQLSLTISSYISLKLISSAQMVCPCSNMLLVKFNILVFSYLSSIPVENVHILGTDNLLKGCFWQYTDTDKLSGKPHIRKYKYWCSGL